MLVDKLQREAGEDNLKQTRRHWFGLLAQLFGLIIGALAPLALLAFLPGFFSDFATLNLSSYAPEITFAYSLWLLFIWIGLFTIWTNYYLDLIIITDRRLILLNQKGFFRRNVASFRLQRLQDMNVEVHGIIATLLDYGTLTVETAGHSDEEFRANGLPNPRDLKALILRASDQRLQEMNVTPRVDNL